MDQLKKKNIYLAPKNNFTVAFNNELKTFDIIIKGYLDNCKIDYDVIDKTLFNEEDVVIIFSPNHWKEIISNLNTKNIFILNVENKEFIVKSLSTFNGYKTIPELNYNKLSTQKYFWNNHLENFYTNELNMDRYGYEWGDPENSKDELGDYLYINNKVQSLINSKSTILEIGTLGGKWTKYMLNANKIICVDINEYFIKVLNERYQDNLPKLEFYISNGNELNGIKTNSIDIIFCMDTLVRVEKEYIFDYLREIARVLNKEGKAIIHLPNNDIKGCTDRKFTEISTTEINTELNKYFDDFKLDSQTIVHGTLVYINC